MTDSAKMDKLHRNSMTAQCFRKEILMNKEDLTRVRAVKIANQLCNRIKTNNDKSERPFVTGWSN